MHYKYTLKEIVFLIKYINTASSLDKAPKTLYHLRHKNKS